jgi:branched-subunit amino acid ABC-type transport system permease component
MVELLGLDARRIHMVVFAVGTALAMLAGALAAPLQSVYPNMGDGFLIVSFVVVVVAAWLRRRSLLGARADRVGHAGQGLRAGGGGLASTC